MYASEDLSACITRAEVQVMILQASRESDAATEKKFEELFAALNKLKGAMAVGGGLVALGSVTLAILDLLRYLHGH